MRVKYPYIITDKQRLKGSAYFSYYWCSRSWSVGLHLEWPSDIAYWWRFWHSDTVDLSWIGKKLYFFKFALWPPVGISWDIRKRWESEYSLGFLFGYIEIEFTQK